MGTKIVIAYYSNEGSTAKVAAGLAQATGGELRRLNVPGKPGPGAIFAALLGIGARLVDTDLALDAEDAVVLMTPVWVGSPTPASTSFIRHARLQGKRIFFVTVGGSATNPKAVAALEKRLASRGAVVAGHSEIRGKAYANPQAATPATPATQPDPTDEELTAAGAALAGEVTSALTAAGVAQ